MSEQGNELFNELQDLTKDLLWMSEIDAPFEVFHWEGAINLTDQQFLERTHHSMDTEIETLSIDEFFATATQDQDWFGAEEKAVAAKYRSLVNTLKQHLTNLKVYQVGEVNLDLYVVGQTQTGETIGLVTQAVET